MEPKAKLLVDWTAKKCADSLWRLYVTSCTHRHVGVAERCVRLGNVIYQERESLTKFTVCFRLKDACSIVLQRIKHVMKHTRVLAHVLDRHASIRQDLS